MGNLVSNENGELINNELSRQITKWAVDNYNEGNETELYNKLLKKRACCTRQSNIPIPLLSWDNKTSKWEYSSVYIPVFNKDTDITENNCKFEKNVLGENSLYYSIKESDNFIKSIGKCETLYKSFCNKIYNDNNNFYGPDKAYYGIYLDEPSVNNVSGINLQNAYIDCNCENSILKKEAIVLIENNPNSNVTGTIDSSVATQNLDERCSSKIDKTFKTTDNRKDMLCVNNVIANGNVSISDAGRFKVDQKCQQEKNALTAADIQAAILAALSNGGRIPEPQPQPQPQPQTPQPQPQPQTPQPQTPQPQTPQPQTPQRRPTNKAGELSNNIDNNTINKNIVSTSVYVENNKNPGNTSKKSPIGIIIGCILGALIIIIIIIVIIRKKSKASSYNLSNQQVQQGQYPLQGQYTLQGQNTLPPI